MIFTTVRIERPEGTVVARGIAVQIEAAQPSDVRAQLDFADARPYDAVWIYSTQGVPPTAFQRRDVLYDEVNLDAETGQLAKYRIVGAVETFAGDHQEALCEHVFGR